MNRFTLLSFLLFLSQQGCEIFSSNPFRKAKPDRYQELVAQAENTDDPVDFVELREAFLKSQAFIQHETVSSQVSDLRKEMFEAMNRDDATKVRDKARAIIKLDFLDLEAQKSRYQACTILKEEPCATRGKRTELGLLKAVVSSGDGKSCATAWKVVTINEEYFILRMRGYKMQEQSVAQEAGKTCDKMHVVDEDGKTRDVYFGINDMLLASPLQQEK